MKAGRGGEWEKQFAVCGMWMCVLLHSSSLGFSCSRYVLWLGLDWWKGGSIHKSQRNHEKWVNTVHEVDYCICIYLILYLTSFEINQDIFWQDNPFNWKRLLFTPLCTHMKRHYQFDTGVKKHCERGHMTKQHEYGFERSCQKTFQPCRLWSGFN